MIVERIPCRTEERSVLERETQSCFSGQKDREPGSGRRIDYVLL
jgi:hypothetical protein